MFISKERVIELLPLILIPFIVSCISDSSHGNVANDNAINLDIDIPELDTDNSYVDAELVESFADKEMEHDNDEQSDQDLPIPFLTALTNRQSGISVSLSGENGKEWAIEQTYHDMAVGDQIIYLKSTVNISLDHNENNTIMKRSGTSLDAIQGKSGGGEIHYKIDRDMQAHYYSSKGEKVIPDWAPKYSVPFNFDTLTYDGVVKVLERTGDNGKAWGEKPRSTLDRFAYGQKDKYGNEYHTLTYWDDDEKLYADASESSHRQGASDGHFLSICVNPVTPVILFKADGAEQFYTTPLKTYHVPKIWKQTTYLTSGVKLSFVNLSNDDNIFYRVDSGTWKHGNHMLLASNILKTGENILEVKNGEKGPVLERKIIMNPDYPAPKEKHGYMLWANDTEYAAVKHKIKNIEPFKKSYETLNNSYYNGSDKVFSDVRDGWNSGSGMAQKSLNNAFVMSMEGAANVPEIAKLAKKRLLRMARLTSVGFEIGVSDATPSKDYTNELGQVTQNFGDAGIAYDLVAAHFRKSDHSGGMTPIEEIRIRDGLAEIAKILLQTRGNWSFEHGSGDTHWGHGNELAIGIIAHAMPSYSTPYFGVSGSDHSTLNGHKDSDGKYWNPFPDQGVTWIEAVTNPDIETPGHPNVLASLRSDFQITDNGFWTGPNDYKGDGERYLDGPLWRVLVDPKYGNMAKAEARIELVEMDGYEAPFQTRIYALDYIRRLRGGITQQSSVTTYINRKLVAGATTLSWDATKLRYTKDQARISFAATSSNLGAYNNHYPAAGLAASKARLSEFLTFLKRYYKFEEGTYPDFIDNDRKALYSPYTLSLCWDPSQITVAYNGGNKAPIIKPAAKYVVKSGETIFKEFIIMDPEGETLTVTLDGLPSGALFNPENHTLAWTPTKSSAGVNIVTVTATDGVSSTTTPFPMIVKDDAGHGPIPEKIDSLTVTVGSDDKATLTWPLQTKEDVVNYVIYKDGALHAVVDKNSTSFVDTPLPKGSHTRYRVSLYTKNGAESYGVASVPEIVSVPLK